jgi:hypothetical protein
VDGYILSDARERRRYRTRRRRNDSRSDAAKLLHRDRMIRSALFQPDVARPLRLGKPDAILSFKVRARLQNTGAYRFVTNP